MDNILYIILSLILGFIVIFQKERFKIDSLFWQNHKWERSDLIFIITVVYLSKLFGNLLAIFNIIHPYYIFVYGNFICLFIIGIVLHWILFFRHTLNYSVFGLSKQNLLNNLLIGCIPFLLYEFFSILFISQFKTDSFLHIKATFFIQLGLIQLPFMDACLYIIGLIILAPIVEEFIFRGFLYVPFQKRTGKVGAILLTSILWSTAHIQPDAFLKYIIIGVILCYLYSKTKSIIPSITMHFMMNISKLLFYFYFVTTNN